MSYSRGKRLLLSAWIVCNAIPIVYCSDRNLGPLDPAARAFSPWLRWTRLLQHWGLFTPEPVKRVTRYRVEIQFADGQRVLWTRPYPPNWDFFERHLSYAYSKWDLKTGDLRDQELLWPDLANYLADLYWDYGRAPPRRFELIRSQAPLPPPPAEGDVYPDLEKLPWAEQSLGIITISSRPRGNS